MEHPLADLQDAFARAPPQRGNFLGDLASVYAQDDPATGVNGGN